MKRLDEIKEIIFKLEDIDEVAEKLIQTYSDKKLWLFEGEMGSGKTTLIKSLCKKLGVKDIVNSPTYNIVNEYIFDGNKIIYHFDMYRLKTFEEADQLGIDEYIDKAKFCFIEWPSKIKFQLPENILNIRISNITLNIRKIILG